LNPRSPPRRSPQTAPFCYNFQAYLYSTSNQLIKVPVKKGFPCSYFDLYFPELDKQYWAVATLRSSIQRLLISNAVGGKTLGLSVKIDVCSYHCLFQLPGHFNAVLQPLAIHLLLQPHTQVRQGRNAFWWGTVILYGDTHIRKDIADAAAAVKAEQGSYPSAGNKRCRLTLSYNNKSLSGKLRRTSPG
jgi:hypothetical protein